MTTTPEPIRGPMQRKEAFGASEAAALCGVSEYRMPLDVYAAWYQMRAMDKINPQPNAEADQ